MILPRLSLTRAYAAGLALSLGLFASCSEPNSSKTTGTDSTAAPTAKTVAVDPGLTLPVLDALFYEENFAQELKSKIGLTDEQVSKLKAAAQASVSDLDEKGDGMAYLGSARAASKRSEEQLNSILGAEKAAQLRQFVAQQYASGDLDGLLPTKPNAVPTDTRIVVNAAAYRMDVFQDGRLLKTYRVGIGYPEFPLPAGMRRAETIIFNPTWTPPDEPWVKGKFAPGKTVEAGSKDNPLGPIKIPIGLPNLIHGGKQPAKLGGFASHGCVGLTNEGVQDFATTLGQLSGSPLTAAEVQGYGTQRGSTKNYKLAKAIPVELRYETIVAENGGLRVYRDVYERGTNTVDHANKVLQVYGLSYDALPAPEKSALLQALQEMNRDPQGHAIVENIGGGAASDSTAQLNNGDATKSSKAKSGGETKTIKGRKDVAVPIAALAGKGYPAPVNVVGAPPADTTARTVAR